MWQWVENSFCLVDSFCGFPDWIPVVWTAFWQVLFLPAITVFRPLPVDCMWKVIHYLLTLPTKLLSYDCSALCCQIIDLSYIDNPIQSKLVTWSFVTGNRIDYVIHFLNCFSLWNVCFYLTLFYFPLRFGRKKVIFISLVAQLVSVLIQAFSPSWEVFCIMFTFVGASQISLYISAFVLGKHWH